MKINRNNINPYTWGNDCKGWHLVNNPSLSVIQESMPPNTEEVRHKHINAQQFFFILKGQVTFELNGNSTMISQGEGIHIEKGMVHKISNTSNEDIEFLVISQPHAHGDRVES